MPRDAVAVTALTSGSATATPAGTAINADNGAKIVNAGDTSRLLIRVTNTDEEADHVFTILAGPNPPAPRAGIGDLAYTVGDTTGDVIVVIESARFMQADGCIYVDFDADSAGAITAIRLPKGA